MRIATVTILLGLFSAACPAVAQEADEAAVAMPEEVNQPTEAQATGTAGAEQPAQEETGPGADLRKAIAQLNADPTQLKLGSEVEKKLTALSEGAEGLIEAAYDLGVFYVRLNELDKAYQTFQGVLARDSGFAEAIAQLGVIADKRNEYDKAAALMDQALNLDKYCATARNYLARKALNEGKPDDALKHCRIVLLGNPDDMNAYLNMAIALYQKGQLDVGELVCDGALRLDKTNASILNVLGLIHLKREDVKSAISVLLSAVQSDPEYIDARKNLAAVMLNYKDFANAATHLEIILKKEPENQEFKTSYAVALRGLDRFDEARQALNDVLLKNPSNLDAKYNLCILLHEYLNDYNEALNVCLQFRNVLDKKHPKYKEMELRIKGIRETIKAMEDMKALESAPRPEKKEEAPAPTPPAEEKKDEAPAPPPPAEEKKEEAPAPPPPAEEKKDENPAGGGNV
jgi:tetratricopeptide (TPR) repeat protein